LLLGEPFLAEAALEVGLVNRVVPPSECNALVQAQARKLAAKPLSALIETKRLMKAGQSGLVRERMAEEGASFGKLMGGLESQLGGMGTAFSSSLLGLAGSLVVGLLELFVGHGQNRFFRELEEWISSITRIGLSGESEGGGDMGQLAQVLDNLSTQIENLQVSNAQSDVALSVVDDRLAELGEAINRLSRRMEQDSGQTALLIRIADGQEKLITALTGDNSAASVDAESRMRLRSIDVQLLRVLEEISAGRQETLADLRHDLAALTQAIRQASRARA
ncbi:MAG TPA: hypothetical protein DEF16_15735, partial [Gemmobacter sp.]|nr:hypothetical protein [Gemmobacter sp.]